MGICWSESIKKGNVRNNETIIVDLPSRCSQLNINKNYDINYKETINKKIFEENNSNEMEKVTTNPKGLINLGLSCYMNSLLQCLYYIKDLRNYFINKKDSFSSEQRISKALSRTMYMLKNDQNENIAPEEFKNVIGKKNSLFFGVKAADAKDLFFNLIDSLLLELSNNDSFSSSHRSYNFTNKLDIFNQAKKEVDQKCIINKLFIGYYETEYHCPKGKNVYSYESNSFILFNMENILKYYKEENLSLKNCFEYYSRLQEKSSFFCSFCNQTHENTCIEKIFQPPKILVIILDRGKGKIYRGKVDFDLNINLKKYIDKDNQCYSPNYQLIGVINHSGESSSSGHYTACCLTDENDKKYYFFSDEFKEPIRGKEINKYESYLLFYQNIN